jgi:phosphatidate cytidylyltransferase
VITVAETAPYVAGALGIGGVGVWLSRRRELILRWCTWAATAPVVGGALYFGAPGAAALAAGTAVVCATEFGRLVRLPLPDRVAVAAAGCISAVAAWLAPHALPRLVVAAIITVAAVPVVLGDTTDGLRRLGLGVIGVVWLSALSGLVLLGPAAFPRFFAVSLADVAAFCGGRLIGGPRLSPLSPAKRWAGALCGGAVGLATLAALDALTPALAVAVVIGAPLGDLVEPMVKRGAGAKDAGTWLPGFGGLLDRVDSLLLALPIAVVLS